MPWRREHHGSRSESIRVFRVLPEPFDVSNGLLTPSMKLRRDAIAHRYAVEIDGCTTRVAGSTDAESEELPLWTTPTTCSDARGERVSAAARRVVRRARTAAAPTGRP